MPGLCDRHGLALSTHLPHAVEQYIMGLDQHLSLNAGGVEGLAAATEADPEFALGYAGLACAQWYRQDVSAAKASAGQARALAASTTPREQRHVEIVDAFVNGEALRALPLIQEHLAEFPRDSLVVHLGTMIIASSGRVARRQEAYDFLARLAPVWDDDWWFLGAYAFAHHELNRLDDARRFAERSLEQRPRNAGASHPLAHVYYESNNHGAGVGFLREWIAGYDRGAPFFCHLSWHLALFELMQGNTARVLELYDTTISPAVGHHRTTLVDSASLLWRYQLYGCEPKVDLPWEGVCDYAAKATPKPGMAFLDAHAALVFAAMDSHDAMTKLIEGLEGQAATGRPLFAEVLVPLARGIEAFGQGAYVDAIGWLEPLDGQLVRVGGSHAQWEVFEDTLLQAYLRAGRFEPAEKLLRRRLAQRSSARDIVWLEQATSYNGAGVKSPETTEPRPGGTAP
jgi:tetratricopeptide (TPR) repeat protein